MPIQNPEQLFTPQALDDIFPRDRADRFFDALFGDAGEGAYDIRLVFKKHKAESLEFAFELHQRPGRCLACNLTYGLPRVFARHPVIDVQGVVEAIGRHLGNGAGCTAWRLGTTEEITRRMHRIPLVITLAEAA